MLPLEPSGMISIENQFWCSFEWPLKTGFTVFKTCLKRPLKNRQNQGLNMKLYLNGGRKYCRMLPLEHSAILLTLMKR